MSIFVDAVTKGEELYDTSTNEQIKEDLLKILVDGAFSLMRMSPRVPSELDTSGLKASEFVKEFLKKDSKIEIEV